MTQLATRNGADIIEQVIIKGDLKDLSPGERTTYYREVCRSLGLNELTRPFEYITLNGRLTLYARKDCTDQLRTLRGVSVVRLEREHLDDLYVVTATARDQTGRQDSSIGAVNIKGLGGENLANALMKAETKAKRRVTLSLCGLGWSDEAEVDSIPSAQRVVVDHATGEVMEQTPAPTPPKMITSTSDRLYKRYADLFDEAIQLKLEPRMIDLPLDAAQLTAFGAELAEAIKRKRAEHLMEVEAL